MYEEFEKEYPKILFFSSNHCAPCKPIEETLNRINLSLFGKRLKIEKILIDHQENRSLTQKYRITSVPTVVIADKKLTVPISKDDIIDCILYAFISSVKI